MNPDHCKCFQVKQRPGRAFRIAAAKSRCSRTLDPPRLRVFIAGDERSSSGWLSPSSAQLPVSSVCKEVHQVRPLLTVGRLVTMKFPYMLSGLIVIVTPDTIGLVSP